MKKTLFLTLTAFALVSSIQSVLAYSNNYCGPNCTFSYTPTVDENGNPVMVTETYQTWNSQTRRWETKTREVQAQTLNISGTGTITEGNWAGNSQITTVNIGEGITATSEAGNFSSLRNLENVSLPSTLTTLGKGAFADDPKLKNINLPENLQSIGSSAFRYSGLTSIDIPNSVTSIGSTAFAYCSNLTNVNLPDNLTTIGDFTFTETGLTSIDLPDSLVSIGLRAFYGTKLTDVTIPDSVISIGGEAFVMSSLQSMTIEGDYVSFSSQTATQQWAADDYGINIGDAMSTIIALSRQGASNLQNLYCSVEMAEECQKLLNSAAALLKTSPASLTTFEKSGDYYMVGHDRYSSLENMRNGIKSNKRIYTVEEAAKVSKETGNTFRVRYK